MDRSTRFSLAGALIRYSGYGQLTEEVYSALLYAGIEFQTRPLIKSCAFGAVYPKRFDSLESCTVPDCELIVHPPDGAGLDNVDTSQFTMWETTRLPTKHFDNLSKRSAIIVPSQWGKSCLQDQGISAPIYVVPLGVHPDIFFKRKRRNPNGVKCVFGASGRMKHGGVRKGLKDVIRVFLTAFRTEPDVRLHIKCYPDCGIECSDRRVIITAAHLTDDDLTAWLAGIDCFVSLSKAEGWGLLQHQALALGRPLISTLYSGVCEFFKPEFGYVVRHEEVKSDKFYENTGCWAEPNYKDAEEKMREVYSDVDSAYCKGDLASVSVSKLTWRNTGNALIGVLKDLKYV